MSAFSSNESSTLERKVDIVGDLIVTSETSLEYKYELERCAKWIQEINAKKVCLQFPDCLLADSVSVALRLGRLVAASVFVLGDTSYGSCCVDEVAAQHVAADAVVHFGHACLSPTARLPVLYVFEKRDADARHFRDSFRDCFATDAKVLVLYEVHYFHVIDKLCEELLRDYPNLVISKLSPECHGSREPNCGGVRVKKLGREFVLAEGSSLCDYQVVFVGEDGRTLSNFVMDMDGAAFHLYSPAAGLSRYEGGTSRFLMRRQYLGERVRDAATLGVVGGTLGVADYLGAVERIRGLARGAGKKCYIIAVGKPNVPKLANFPEVDVFVLVACPENSLLDSKDFYRPVVTCFDVEMALTRGRDWKQSYVTDFRQLLPGGSHYQDLADQSTDDQPTDVSLVTGRVRSLLRPLDCDEPSVGGSSVALKADSTVSVGSTGGVFLQSRSWQGLEQQLGQTEVTLAQPGRSGIAQNYSEME